MTDDLDRRANVALAAVVAVAHSPITDREAAGRLRWIIDAESDLVASIVADTVAIHRVARSHTTDHYQRIVTGATEGRSPDPPAPEDEEVFSRERELGHATSTMSRYAHLLREAIVRGHLGVQTSFSHRRLVYGLAVPWRLALKPAFRRTAHHRGEKLTATVIGHGTKAQAS